jgi:prefoldin subunit 5
MITQQELKRNAMNEINRTIEHLKFQAESFAQSLAHIEYFCDSVCELDKSLEKSAKEQEVPTA